MLLNLTALVSARRSSGTDMVAISDELSVEALVPQLCRLIEDGCEIRFVHRGEGHVMRPHILFRDGNKTCLGGPVDSSCQPRSFDIAEMTDIVCTGETFEADRRWRMPRGEHVSIICTV